MSGLVLVGACDSGADSATAASSQPTNAAPTSLGATTQVAAVAVSATTSASAVPTVPNTLPTPATTVVVTAPPSFVPTTPAPAVPATSLPTTTPPGTTAAPTLEQEVLAAVQGAYFVWRECTRSIPTCDSATLAEFRTGTVLASNERRLAEWRAGSNEVIDVDSYQYEVLEVSLDTNPVFVVVCERDSSSLVQRIPGQPERLVESGHVEAIRELHLELTPDGWKVEAFATRERVENVVGALCQ